MNTPSSSVSSSSTSVPSKVIKTNNSDPSELVTINEKVNLTKEQNDVLRMICNSYEMTISEYLQLAVVEAMRFDIEDGNFSDVLLEKIGEGNGKKKIDSTQSNSLEDELEKLQGSKIA